MSNTAARHFKYGIGSEVLVFEVGEEVPEEIADEIPNHLILERLAQADPEELTRDQLMRLAGVGPYAEGGELAADIEGDEFDEDEFREALGEFPNKGELVAWAGEFFPEVELDADKMKRSEIEDAIVDAAEARGEGEEE